MPNIRNQGNPLYLEIVDSLEDDIRSGRLQSGYRLPPHRVLAERMGVALGTVTRAYREAQNRGLIRGSGKLGTFVDTSFRHLDDFEEGSDTLTAIIDLSLNYPSIGEDPDPSGVFRNIAESNGSRRLMRYTAADGFARHRQAGVEWVRLMGLEVNEKAIVPTQGAQQAIWAILTLVAGSGDIIAADQLTYSGLIGICNVLGIRLVPVQSDEGGILPDHLESVCIEHNPKAIYLVPTLNNPTNTIIPLDRRKKIAAVADKYGLNIIEDDIYRLLVDSSPPLLSAMLPEKSFLIASASKLVAGGIRVGFAVPPRAEINALKERLGTLTLMTSPVALEILTRWISDGTVHKIIDTRKKDSAGRQFLARKILGEEYATYPQSNSYYIWLPLPGDWTSNQFTAEAQNQGVLVSPSSVFSIDKNPPVEAVRICLAAAVTHDRLKTALSILRDILRGAPAHSRCAL